MINLRGKVNTNKGITLIALVITIIVLLILAAVSIATLTGENGILTKARTAKEETDKATAKEKVQVAVLGSFDEKGQLDINELKENLKKEGITDFTENEDSSLTANVDGYIITIAKDGEVSVGEKETPSAIMTMEEAKTKNKFDLNTEVEDPYGNKFKVPEGFKIASDSADDVTGGIVIEDVSNLATAGSQFVWIPIGDVYTAKEHTEANRKTIILGRYEFAQDGTPSAYSGNSQEENARDTANLLNYGNVIAKDIVAFQESSKRNNGYYIGRYEARTEIERTNKSNNSQLGQVTVKSNDYIYNYVSQKNAADLSQEMYLDKSFTSDLTNSYAWDTSIVFIQTFGQNNYSRQKSLNKELDGLALKGTNNLQDVTKQDKQCNIWDMASNVREYTTETGAGFSTYPILTRGGYYTSDFYTSSRNYVIAGDNTFSFRPILYF